MSTQSSIDTMPVKRRLEWLDIAKGIAIILVVVGHTVSNPSLIRSLIFTFHMPLFFILAGYTFRPKPFKEAFASSAKRLLLPYCLLFVVWWGITYFRNPLAFTPDEFMKLIGVFVFASGVVVPLFNFEAVGMAWFLVCLFCSRLILNALMKPFVARNVHPAVQCIIVLVIGALGVYIGSTLRVFLPFSFDVAMVAVPLMWVGYVAKKYRFVERFGHKWQTAVIALIIYGLAVFFSQGELAARIYGNAPLLFLGAIAGTLFVCQLSMLIERLGTPLKTYLLFMGKNSLLVYCIHTVDWMIPWTGLAAFEGFPFKTAFYSLVRIVYVSCFTWLVRRV